MRSLIPSAIRGRGPIAYSAQFEIGPLSEESIGAIQSRWPEQGMVDHVVTPTIDRFENKRLRMLVRSWTNPSRSMANLVRGTVPWRRDSRPGIRSYRKGTAAAPSAEPEAERETTPVLEFLPRMQLTALSDGQCPGGGAQTT